LENLLFTAQVVAPVFLLVLVGFYLQRRGVINEEFNITASKVVFQVALPALVFLRIAQTRFADMFRGRYILLLIIGLSIMYGLFWLFSTFVTRNGKDRGAFIQASFRGNFAIIGFGLIYNAFGDAGLALAAIVLAVMMPFFNVYSIVALTVPQHSGNAVPFGHIFKQILTNPLILAALIALPFSVFGIPIHSIFVKSIDYLAKLTLPLALIAIGGRLTFKNMQENLGLATIATVNKIIIMPIILISTLVVLGVRGQELGVAFFLFASPTAVASFPMAEAMHSNGRLAGNIVLLTTMCSILTISLGVFILKTLGLF